MFLTIVNCTTLINKKAFHIIERRMGKITAQVAVQAALQVEGGAIFIKDVTFIKDSRGKPHVIIDKNLQKDMAMSMSHSYPYALAVARKGKGVVGCDVERVRDFVPTTTDAFLTPNEKAILARYSPQIRKIKTTLAWSYKESILKAIGTGLRTHPSKVDVSPLLGTKKEVRMSVKIGRTTYVFTPWSKQLAGGYVATVVAEMV